MVICSILNIFSSFLYSFFYSDNENIIRIISSIIGREVCGDCMAILHSDNL